MDPTPEIVNSLILPYAAFQTPGPKPPVDDEAIGLWSNGHITPKTDNQTPPPQPECELWDIDGGETDRGFFCTVPKFARHKPPLRVTTTMAWDQTQYSTGLSEKLELEEFFRAGKRKILDLPLTGHLRKALTYWASQRPDFECEYQSLPFGSSIVVDSLHEDVTRMAIRVTPNSEIEGSWLSLDGFAKEISISVESLSKITVPWESLELLSHPHENISIVRIAGQPDDTSFVFKALMEDTRYMYHELRLQLSMESHPNIVGKPPALVLKQRANSEPGIAGFLLDNLPGPTLQHRLQMDQHPMVTAAQKTSWACQLISALLHVRAQTPGGYFPDFKPNNVVFSYAGNPILLDFEQRGTWYMWTAPEVRYVEYLELLALTSDKETVRERYRSVLREAFPYWSPTYQHRPPREAKDGYNLAWIALDKPARAKAQMYAVGKVLWCLFENVPTPDGPNNVESFLEDYNQDQQFPEFRLSPPVVQQLIRRCTAGAPEWDGRHAGVVRDGDRIVPWGKQGCEVTANETQEAATRWWQEELGRAEDFLRHRYVQGGQGEMSQHVSQLEKDIEERPSLEEVMDILSGLPTFELAEQ